MDVQRFRLLVPTRRWSILCHFCFEWWFHKRRMLEDNDCRLLGECGVREFILVRVQVPHVGLSFYPIVDTAELLRTVWTRFEVVVAVMHGNQDRWCKLTADRCDLVRLKDVEL